MLNLFISIALARPAPRPIRCDVSAPSGHIGEIVLKEDRTARASVFKIDGTRLIQISRTPDWIEVSFVSPEPPKVTAPNAAHRTYLGNQQKLINSIKTADADVVCKYVSAESLKLKARPTSIVRPQSKELEDEYFGFQNEPTSKSTSKPSGGSSR